MNSRMVDVEYCGQEALAITECGNNKNFMISGIWIFGHLQLGKRRIIHPYLGENGVRITIYWRIKRIIDT